MYIGIAIGQTPRSMIVGLKDMCIENKKILLNHLLQKGYSNLCCHQEWEWISSEHLTLREHWVLSTSNFCQPYSWKMVIYYFIFPRLLVMVKSFFKMGFPQLYLYHLPLGLYLLLKICRSSLYRLDISTILINATIFFSTYHLIIDFVYDVLSYRILYCYIISAATLCCYGFWFFFLLKAFHTQMIKIVSMFSSKTLLSFTKSLNPFIICCYTWHKPEI